MSVVFFEGTVGSSYFIFILREAYVKLGVYLLIPVTLNHAIKWLIAEIIQIDLD